MEDEKNIIVKKDSIFPSRTITMIVGVLVTVFAVVGVVFTVIYAVEGATYLITQQGTKQDYEKMIAPVVMLDPPAVDTPEKLDNSTIIAAGILDIVLNGNQYDYQGDDMAVYIPAIDVNAHIKKLFGNVPYQDATVATSAYTFEYSGETQMYMVQRDIQFFSYQPKVEEITKDGDGDSVLLHVGYQPQGAAWGANTNDREQESFKYMDYLLQKQGDSYIVQQIRMSNNTQNDATLSSTSSQNSSSDAQPDDGEILSEESTQSQTTSSDADVVSDSSITP